MMNALTTPTAQLVAGLLIGVAVFAAFAIGGDVGSAAINGGLVMAFVVLVHIGRRRSQALEVTDQFAVLRPPGPARASVA